MGGTVITGGAGDSHLIEYANQQMQGFFAAGIGEKTDILLALDGFAKKFFKESMQGYQGLVRSLVPDFEMLIAVSIKPQTWLFHWRDNRVVLIPQFEHTSIGVGKMQIHPMLRDVQFSGTCEQMLLHGVRMMFHAKRMIVGVGGKTEAIALHGDGVTHYFGTDATKKIEDLIVNLEQFCIKFLYNAVSNTSAPEKDVKRAFANFAEIFLEYLQRYRKILKLPSASGK